jgi:hypothetical protein
VACISLLLRYAESVANHNSKRFSMSVRRVKTYTAQTGYVYEYYFVGKRPALPDEPLAPATEYIFDVSSDRKSIYAVSIFLSADAVPRFSSEHGRALSEPEQYASAKLRLLQAFDEIPDMLQNGRRLLIDAESLAQLLASVGVD